MDSKIIMSNDEIIAKILSRAKDKKGETIPVEHIMKSELAIREIMIINRIIQIMQDNEIGGKLLPGGALLWNEKARKICDEGYLNYVNRLRLAEIEEEEHKKIIRENDKITLSIHKHDYKFRLLHLIIIISSFIISVISLLISIFYK